MKRKIVRHGPATLTVSLPSVWVKQWNLKNGDELNLSINGSQLLVSMEKFREHGSIDKDITGLDRSSIILYLRNLYRRGYQDIILRYSEPEALHIRKQAEVLISRIINEEANRLIGMEVVDQKERSTRLMEVTEASGRNFDMMYRKNFFLAEEAVQVLLEAVSKNNAKSFYRIEDLHDRVAKTGSYCIRLLNQGMASDQRNQPHLFNILMNLDLLLDIIKYFSRHVAANKKRFSKKNQELFVSLSENFVVFSKLMMDYSNGLMYEFQEKRKDLTEKAYVRMQAKDPDMIFFSYLLSLLDVTRIMSETKLSMIDLEDS